MTDDVIAVREIEKPRGGRGFRVKSGLPGKKFGAGNETRTRDPDLGKVVLYQLSYSRLEQMQRRHGTRDPLRLARLRGFGVP